jgi:hypothetical protein
MEIQLNSIVGKWALIITPSSSHISIERAIGMQALQGKVVVFVGGNSFNIYTVSQAVNYREAILHRVLTARAFTCHHMLALLEDRKADAIPTVILDFLSTFYDENVSISERNFLLSRSLTQIKRLSLKAAITVSSFPPPASSKPNTRQLYERFCSSAPIVERYEDFQPPPDKQVRLF